MTTTQKTQRIEKAIREMPIGSTRIIFWTVVTRHSDDVCEIGSVDGRASQGIERAARGITEAL
jgi:hypothetical protein